MWLGAIILNSKVPESHLLMSAHVCKHIDIEKRIYKNSYVFLNIFEGKDSHISINTDTEKHDKCVFK